MFFQYFEIYGKSCYKAYKRDKKVEKSSIIDILIRKTLYNSTYANYLV